MTRSFLPTAAILGLAAYCWAGLRADEVAQVSSGNKEKPVPATSAQTPSGPTAPQPAAPKEPARDKPKDKDMAGMPPDRETAVLAFVKNNHPELAELLSVLKQNQPKEYQKALRELHRSSERLATIFENDRPRYDLEVALWKAQSRIQLLAARLRTKADEKYRDELKVVLTEQQGLKLQILELERQRLKDRAAKLDAEIAKLKTDPVAAVNRQLDSLLGPVKKPAKPKANEAGK